MRLHVLGICGTFMGSLAILAKQLGHQVSGSDINVYPPMSTQLEMAAIELKVGYSIDHLKPCPDQVIVGNVIARGNEIAEYLLNNHLPYTSGPAWLHDHVLQENWVLAVAGTHGKTTTASMLAWILEHNGLRPGFLIGGVPQNFDYSARAGESQYFVIEADEYDTAFFDKRSKFVHYRPRTLVINNLEFDHADIFDDINDVQRQFHHLLRTIPDTGLVIVNHDDSNVQEVIQMGCWTPTESFSTAHAAADWYASDIDLRASRFTVRQRGKPCGVGTLQLTGRHNVANAIAAIAAARHAGVGIADSLHALQSFAGVKRRLEYKGTFDQVNVYDDFAHHPTEIAATISAFQDRSVPGRIITVFEPRSNTMRMGAHTDRLAAAFTGADKVLLFEPHGLQWSMQTVAHQMRPECKIFSTTEAIIASLLSEVKKHDHVLVLSNGSFDNLSAKLARRLSHRETSALHSCSVSL